MRASRRTKPLRRDRLPWAFGLLAISVFHVANANRGNVRARHLGVMLSAAMGER